MSMMTKRKTQQDEKKGDVPAQDRTVNLQMTQQIAANSLTR